MIFILTHLPVLQILLPFISALLTIFSLFSPNISRAIAIIAISFNLLISFYGFINLKDSQVFYSFGNWLPTVGIEYQLNSLNQSIIAYLNLVLLFFLVCFKKLIEETILRFINDNRKSLFYSILLFAHTGYLGMVSTNDFFNLYVFIEISSLSSYVLMSQGGDKRSLIGAFDYLIMGSIGATLILIAIGFLLCATGALNMSDVSSRLASNKHPALIVIAISFFFTGVMLKIAFFPMHFWMIRAYRGTAAIILTYLASISTIIGIYVLYKFSYIIINYELIAKPLVDFVRPVALIILIIVPYFAYTGKSLREIIIYSTLTQIGYVFLLFITNETLSILPSFLLVDSLNKIALFFIIAYIETYKKKMTYKTSWYVLVIITIICSCGLPISPLFFIKLNMLDILLKHNLLLDFTVILISSVSSLLYHYKMIKLIFWDNAFVNKVKNR